MLPLFPLTTVLFPGAPMPLHIFEPRYRQMLADCLAGDRRFGLVPGEQAEPGAVGCIAHIRVAQPLADGRSNIVVVGEKRFRLVAIETSDQPYLMGRIEDYEDRPDSAPSPEDQSALIQLAERYRESLRVLMDGAGNHPSGQPSPSALISSRGTPRGPARDSGPSARDSFDIGADSRAHRSAPPLLREAGARVEVHVRSSSNGVGGPHHEIVAEG
jgi:hypothetical protein